MLLLREIQVVKIQIAYLADKFQGVKPFTS